MQNYEPNENTTASFNDLQNTEMLAANEWYEFELQEVTLCQRKLLVPSGFSTNTFLNLKDTISRKTQSNTDGSIVILTVNNEKESDAINETLTELEGVAVADTLTKENSLITSDTGVSGTQQKDKFSYC